MDGASGGSRALGDPEGLLRSALEKIVFFECRVSQLESELASARASAERERGEAAAARRHEVEIEQARSRDHGAREEADRRAADAEERVRLLEAERERLLGGLVDRARLSGAPGESEPAPEEGGADLAGFIAELRAEIEVLRAFRSEAEAAGFRGAGATTPPPRRDTETSPPLSLTALAAGYHRAGRVGLTARDTDRMKDLLGTRADRALYERSMDDLSAPDAGKRLRAVRSLEALGSKAAAPLLAASLGREPDTAVKSALLGALARLGEPFAADLAARELADPRPAIRVAALDALAAVGPAAAEGKLTLALGDPSPLVRRRAALLLGFAAGERAEDALAAALADPDRGVARAAAAALSGRPSARAQGALARGLEHRDASVRRATAAALSRLSGESVDGDAPLSARRATSRRIAAKLAGMGGEEIRAAVMRSAEHERPAPRRPRARCDGDGGEVRDGDPDGGRASAPASTTIPTATATIVSRTAPAPAARTAVAVLASAPAPQPPPEPGPPPGENDDLPPRILGEIRAALRGCTSEDLAGALGAPQASVDAALHALAHGGEVAKRGTRWFTS